MRSVHRNLAAGIGALVLMASLAVAAPPFAQAVDPPAVRTIAEIQGTGAVSPLVGQTVSTSGVVTAAFPTGGLKGFYIQTAGTGGPRNLAVASNGIFVYQPARDLNSAAVPGNFVTVTGAVSEFNGLTQLTALTTGVVDAGDAPSLVTASTTATWPATETQRESLEGMLYNPTGKYTVTNTFSTNQFGEVGLAFGTKPLIQPTEVAVPALPKPDAIKAVEADNAARRVVLDDGSSTNYTAISNDAAICVSRPTPCLTNGNLTPPYVSNTAPVRVGAAVTFTANVIVDYRFNLWRFQPTAPIGPANTGVPATFTNTRTSAPNEAALGEEDLTVASFNVLNYFTTLGEGAAGCVAFTDRDGDGNTVNSGCDQRGAWDSDDLNRQQQKIINAINALDADVVGLMEIENSAALGEKTDEALATLVAALNSAADAPIWVYVPSSTELPAATEMDVIANAIIYKPAVVQRVGESRALGTESGTLEAFDNAREPIAQVFKKKGGGGDKFLFVVNHFKSKGSAGPFFGDGDQGDGQGASNESRRRQATALRDWIPTVLDETSTTSVVLAGDFNSYTMEDPLRILYDAGFTNVEQYFGGGEYSYSFSGLSGSLDHILVNDEALLHASGADIWDINAGESVALEYSRWNYHATDFNDPGPYRSSDHDPVLLGLSGRIFPTTRAIQVLGINDFHGRIQANGVEAGASVLSGAVDRLRQQYPNTVFAAAGDLIGASTFESFIAHDKPTIDALNEAGLEVSAAGNHEFDQGYDDLVNRVMAPYDPITNPFGGAEWEYLAANVRHDDGSAALPESWVRSFQGIDVGFIGAVTDHLPELVSPAGVAGLTIQEPVVAANRVADQMKDAGVEIVVLLVHEGATDTSMVSATDPASDFGEIVNESSGDIDAIVSGHTHLSYNHAIPVQEWIDEGREVTTRPVVSAGQYGYNLNQLVFTYDVRAGDVVAVDQKILPLVKTPPYASDSATNAIVDAAVAEAEVLGAVELGQIGGPFTRAIRRAPSTAAPAALGENRGGESTLGNLVAEVQQEATEAANTGSAQIAFMNPGGLRTDMVGNPGGYPTALTYKQAANVQPFANTLVNMQLTGDQIRMALEQQWQPTGATRPFLRLGISEGFTYTYDPTKLAGSRITEMWLDGVPIDLSTLYSVTVNSFLSSGGDNFSVFARGTNKRDTGKTDLQAMVDYMATNSPVPVDYTQRSVGVAFPSGAPGGYAAGDTVTFNLSSLAFVSTATVNLQDSQVSVALGETTVGTYPVDNSYGLDAVDEYGKAAVSFALPVGLSLGAHPLTITGMTTGTASTIALTVL